MRPVDANIVSLKVTAQQTDLEQKFTILSAFSVIHQKPRKLASDEKEA